MKEEISVIYTGMEDSVKNAATIASDIFVMVMTVCLFVAPGPAITIIKIFQMADYMLFFNISTPRNLGDVLGIFGYTPFDLFPNPFTIEESADQGSCTAPEKFEENDVSCFVLAEIGQYVLQLGIMILLKIIVKIIVCVKEKDISSKNCVRKIAVYLNDLMNIENFCIFIDGTQLDLYMSVFINFKQFDSATADMYSVVNLGLSCAGVALYSWMTLTILYISTRVHSCHRDDLEPGYKRYYDSFWFMKDGLKTNSWFARHHVAAMYVKDPILGALLVFGHDSGKVQIGSIFVMNFAIFLLYAIYRPFDNKLDNFTEIYNF